MNRREALRTITTAFALVGLSIFSYPFIAALGPTNKIPSDAYEIDISGMEPYSSKFVITKESKKIESAKYTSWTPGRSFLVVRGETHDYYLYLLPIWEGKVMMPYKAWWQHEGYCQDIGVGKYDGTFVIKCSTAKYAEFLTKQWYWSIDGKNLGDDLPDMMKVYFAIDGNTLYAFQR
jgi:hypothetical protein